MVQMLNRKRTKILEDLRSGELSGRDFLIKGIRQLREIKELGGGDLNGNKSFWGCEEKFVEGMNYLSGKDFDPEMLGEYQKKYDELFRVSVEEEKGDAFMEKILSVSRKHDEKSVPPKGEGVDAIYSQCLPQMPDDLQRIVDPAYNSRGE